MNNKGGRSASMPPSLQPAALAAPASGVQPPAAPFNSMQACVLLSLTESLLQQSSNYSQRHHHHQHHAAAVTDDVTSLVHNVVFSPRDALDRAMREVVHPLLLSAFTAAAQQQQQQQQKQSPLVPEAHGESLRVATEALTRCIATAVAKTTLAVCNHGPASDWMELAMACALPRIAVERRKLASGSSAGGGASPAAQPAVSLAFGTSP